MSDDRPPTPELLTPELLARDLALIVFPRQRRRTDGAFHCVCRDDPMYNLTKAKEEIDAVAKHATELAAHVLALSEDIDSKLETLRRDLLGAIDEKFADLKRTLHGGDEVGETSAVADLGAKMSLLSRRAAPAEAAAEEHHEGGHEGGEGHHQDSSHGGEEHHHDGNPTEGGEHHLPPEEHQHGWSDHQP